ncbi:MAG: citrate synthase [Lentisphaerae bacterium]|nr:citrate synthase [Lentisphaerota bacterium]
MEKTARLIVDGKEYEFPLIEGTEGERGIDISTLRARTGYLALDETYANTGICRSSITFIDGEKGILRYRGIPIEELAAKSTFVESAYLVIHGRLPSEKELGDFSELLNKSSLLHEDLQHFFIGFPNNAHPMALLSTIVASLSQFYPVPENFSPEIENQFIANLISQTRTIAAFSYKKSIGEPFVYPSYKYRFTQNFLNMMFSSPVRGYEHDPDIIRALELFLILHLDHEQNCSTSTVRMVGSSGANIYSSISAAICALWGPLHGGANQAVVADLERFVREKTDIRKMMDEVKSKKRKLMGFGHRVYKNRDPRAIILKEACNKIVNKPGYTDPLFDVASQIEEIALTDDYFISRRLYPNVDFYSGLVLRAINIPVNMFTVLFAIGRMPGWLAQWKEMSDNPNKKISRPRQIYTGRTINHYVPMSARK